MTLGDLADHYRSDYRRNSVLRIGRQVLALAMRLEENCRAPEEGADHGEFWCTAGEIRDIDNQTLVESQNSFDVWVRPPGDNSTYQQRGRFRVSGTINNRDALEEASQMKSGEEPVVLIVQIQRVPER